MYFSSQQQAAILSLSKALTLCDGDFAHSERVLLAKEMHRIGITNIDSALDNAEKMEPATACSIISQLPATEKKYVCALFGAIIAIDLKIEDEEFALWSFISVVCNFPKMTPAQAIQYIANL